MDVPQSLAGSMEFVTVTGPADFFPPMGAVTVVAAVATVVLLWRVRRARLYACASLLSLVLDELLFSVLFF